MTAEESAAETLPGVPQAARRAPWVPVAIVISAIFFVWVYASSTRLPEQITIGGGPQGGRYFQLANALAEELQSRLAVKVHVVSTQGSLSNLQSVQAGDFDFGLYQSATQEVLSGDVAPVSIENIRFVSNLFPEYLIPCESSTKPADWKNSQPWLCSGFLSGDYAMLKWLAIHVANQNAESATAADYVKMPQLFQDGSAQVAVLCCGLNSPALAPLFVDGPATLKPIPALDAFLARHPSLTKAVIPAGYFRTDAPVPAVDFSTASLRAQLITRQDLPVSLVEEVTRIVSDAGFQRRWGLTELFRDGEQFAADRPEFPMHAGAAHVYSPELKPLLNPDFVEATEGLRSFVVSLIAAAWLLRRWWVRRKVRSQEHRLDRYIKDLLKMEVDQMELDGDGGDKEAAELQKMLDRVTILRQEALAEFTAHELNEDRAVDCFIEMCHALSDKINAKLTRSVLLSLKR